MALPFSKPPSAALVTPTPFQISIPDSALTEMKTLLKYSKLAKLTFENTTTGNYHGVSREWLQRAKSTWEGNFNWYEQKSLYRENTNDVPKAQE
jgi:microsomal epoxide hydrolase